MGKISPVSAKYIVHSTITIEGVVDRPDVIGAIFGQTEGLLGSELELRELQRSGRIGRIEVRLDTKTGKTAGEIIIPSSLDKAETAIIGSALETIERIGPCNSRVKVEKIEDVRISKRKFIIERAKELLKNLTEEVLPDSQEITDEVAQSVRMMEIAEYGKDRLPAGPSIEESEEVIVVEGRADVLNLLKHGIKNCVAMNGTNVPDTIVELGRQKILTLFVDGDRGGDLIIKEVSLATEVDFVAKAPDGKEVEEITKKEIHKALRGKVAIEQIRMEINNGNEKEQAANNRRMSPQMRRPPMQQQQQQLAPPQHIARKPILSKKEQETFKQMLEDLVGTRGAYLLDQKLNILGKVPTMELMGTIRNLNSVFAIVFDGMITRDITSVSERAGIKYVVAMSSKVRPNETRVQVITSADL